VKLLGVIIDSDLNFDNHISEMCKKASRQLNILKRIGKYMNRLGSLTSYYSFILSNFNYCPVIWHYCSEKNSNKIGKIQERALRFIYEDFLTLGTAEVFFLPEIIRPGFNIYKIM
jgi:hypothetical protein